MASLLTVLTGGAVVLAAAWRWRVLRQRKAAAAQAAADAHRKRSHLPARDYRLSELRRYDGTDVDAPIVLACCGQVFNVSNGREFYGAGGPYRALAGRDASRLLAKSLLEEESADEAARPLEPFEEEALREWEWHFKMKYERLGALIVDDGSAGGDADGGAADEAAPAPSDAAPREAELVDGWRTVRA